MKCGLCIYCNEKTARRAHINIGWIYREKRFELYYLGLYLISSLPIYSGEKIFRLIVCIKVNDDVCVYFTHILVRILFIYLWSIFSLFFAYIRFEIFKCCPFVMSIDVYRCIVVSGLCVLKLRRMNWNFSLSFFFIYHYKLRKTFISAYCPLSFFFLFWLSAFNTSQIVFFFFFV